MQNPPPIIIPRITLMGAFMRISERAERCGTQPIIEADPFTALELRKMIAEDIGSSHPLLNINETPNTVCLFMGVRLAIRRNYAHDVRKD